MMDQIFDIPAERPWSGIVRKGQTIRIEDSFGQQAIDTIFYAAHDFGERYSSQETLKANGRAYIETGAKVMSSEGRLMLTVTADTSGQRARHQSKKCRAMFSAVEGMVSSP